MERKAAKISSCPPCSSPRLILLIISSLVPLCAARQTQNKCFMGGGIYQHFHLLCTKKHISSTFSSVHGQTLLIQRGKWAGFFFFFFSSTHSQTSVSQIVPGRQIGAHNKRSSVIFKSTEFHHERRSAGQKVYLTGNMHTEWILLPCFSFALCIDFFGPI